MGMKTDNLNSRMRPFGVSIFTEMSRLAAEHGALNLSQGFPDFDGPDAVKEAAVRAIREGRNQYVPSHGTQTLRESLARMTAGRYGLDWDPETEVTVFSGATEAIFSSVVALVEPGDEVVCLEPFYDSYAPSVVTAGGTPRFVRLDFPDFALPRERLREVVGERTKVLVLNTPMNPAGKVFDREELAFLAELCIENDVIVLSDEVYEFLTFDGAEHVPIATLPGMRERTVTLSSTAKTFSLTGWKVGYGFASKELTHAIRMTHQFVTFCTPPPFQLAMAEAFDHLDEHLPALREEYTERRDLLYDILADTGFRLGPKPRGSYFLLADFTPFGFDDDREFCHFLTREIGVAAVPPSFFYEGRGSGRNLARFSFCKSLETLREAGKKLERLKERAQA
jgi:N-succinyldiaminopimelate aminotransferase